VKKKFLSTKEVASFLDVNEKMIYSLISEKELPATKITGKWLFPTHLVEKWLENNIINYPKKMNLPLSKELLIIAGSNDILFEKTINLFNKLNSDILAVFGNVGSMGGIQSLAKGICHFSTSHLIQDDESEYNFEYINNELGNELAAVVNFCKREQGLLLAKGNPKNITQIRDISRSDIKIANRPLGTGTRLLFDKTIENEGISKNDIDGYDNTFRSHMDVGIEVFSGRADAAPGISPVAYILGLDFIPLRWERFDLLISKQNFFEKSVQLFINLFNENLFKELSKKLKGYDLSLCGKMIFPSTI